MRFWEFIRRLSNQRLLLWFSGGGVVIAGGIWAVLIYVWLAHELPILIRADQGVAIGGNIIRETSETPDARRLLPPAVRKTEFDRFC